MPELLHAKFRHQFLDGRFFLARRQRRVLRKKIMGLWLKSARLLALDYNIIRYEDLVSDFKTETRKMLDFLELE
jgi:hypothetical protein